jgi:nicotinate-nucleotide pyrophosphorylase (carboxylating)
VPTGGDTLLFVKHELEHVVVEDIVKRALMEDLGAGDVTTDACIEPAMQAVASAVARTPMVACGAAVFERVFAMLDPDIVVERRVTDGALVAAGATLWAVRGRARSILMGERVALNFIQRMIGIASMARAFVDAVPAGCHTRITDTRKTTPGLRPLERYAVRVGGAHNHRDNLGSAVLIKDNHVAACGGVRIAIERARARAPHTSRIECEVDSLEQLDTALSAGADIVLLDNMNDADVAEACRRARGKAVTEASGGITLSRVEALARIGVDVISVGALTHSVKAADVGLDFA